MPEDMKRGSDFHRLDELENKIVQIQVDALALKADDHEKRIRTWEHTTTIFIFIL